MASIMEKVKEAILGAPSLEELQGEEATLLADLAASEAVTRDENATVDQIQTALTRAQAIRLRLETVQRRIEGENARIAQFKRSVVRVEGERLLAEAGEKERGIDAARLVLLELIREHDALIECANLAFADCGLRGAWSGWSSLRKTLEEYEPERAAISAQLLARMS